MPTINFDHVKLYVFHFSLEKMNAYYKIDHMKVYVFHFSIEKLMPIIKFGHV